MGFPPRAWFLEAEGFINDGSLPVQIPHVKRGDTGYFDDFWTVPGYLGTDPDSSAAKDRLVFSTKIRGVHLPGEQAEAGEAAVEGYDNDVNAAWHKKVADGRDICLELEDAPEGEDLYLMGAKLLVMTGEGAGTELTVKELRGNSLIPGLCFGVSDLPGLVRKLKPGDEVVIDNSDYIAIQSYYRHQVPEDPDLGDRHPGHDG